MSKKHKNHEEVNQHNEQVEKTPQDIPADVDKSKNYEQEIISLKKQIEELISSMNSKSEHIESLEAQLENANKEYVGKIQQKANEANILLNQKIEELTAKANNELSEHKKYAIEKHASKLIEIINQFELALSYPQTDQKIINFQNGFKMFLSMLKSLLNDLGINEIIINKGDEFDPHYMECIEFMNEPGMNDNKVIKVLTKGYKLYDRVIQIATVILNRKKN